MSILKGMKRGEERSLNGQWSFLYTSDLVGKKLPSEEEWKKAGKMNVPGYWDDHSDAPLSVGIWQGCLRNPDYVPIKYPMIEGKDSSLPYIIGCGWYRCDLGPIEEEEDDYSLWIEGVMSEVWVWLNEKLLVHQKGYGIPLNLRLHHALKKEENKLIINPYGVSIDNFHSTELTANSYDCLMVGQWSKRKGVDMAVEACRKLGLSLLHVGAISDMPFPK